MQKKTTLCFVAGKSGGHIIPCLTLAQHHKKQNASCHILFFSTTALLDQQIITQSPHVDTHIRLPLASISMRLTNAWYRLPAIAWDFTRSFCTSLYHLHKLKPIELISTGGHIAIPVCIAARILRIPITLHELNVEPGKAIRMLTPLAHTVNICFKKTAQLLPTASCTVADYPIRFTTHDTETGTNASTDSNTVTKTPHTAQKFDLDPAKKTIFIIGGSQGSQFINTCIQRLITSEPLLASRINIIHQTGPTDNLDLLSWYAQHNIPAHVFSYSDNLLPCYQAADLIISRAGAGALFEILFFRKPCILIPLETPKNRHQYTNAYEMATLHPELFTLVRQDAIAQDIQVLAAEIYDILTEENHDLPDEFVKQILAADQEIKAGNVEEYEFD